MRIVRMAEGEIIRDRTIKSRVSMKWDKTESRYHRRVEALLVKKGMFIEGGYGKDRAGMHHWYITNCGDNCLKVYADDQV